jgi:hypothetical protein
MADQVVGSATPVHVDRVFAPLGKCESVEDYRRALARAVVEDPAFATAIERGIESARQQP